ncbi:thiamine-phosphate kinase [Candidatus Thioglobus sp.]|jgi:thiamine-monophosphate kinase|uniref:thiamine-phosphate kinase n=1 Tax=Candidatus Thioglobus sp. TaxID=2026721 RepID=UPI001775BD49|nr:thiamine-phosphate kinase [Candidatus Thioglobus sp.]HIF47715.1 thiamine-phosphate kinase [Candidatus Thioglobus sp.]HIL03595.1 thiamine-phosphate kinase [Candidatus Thioglobus autotrophicus]
MNEFDLIEKYFNWKQARKIELSVGDDCALISIDANYQLATSVDTLIEGVHFPQETSPADIAHKALAVNLSDLAAMGATPKYFTLALTLPEFDQHWLEQFSSSLKSLSDEYQINLVGGDTTKGKLSITINVTGTVPSGQALLRSSAKVGDAIFVSNTIGDAALAWQQIQQGINPSKELLKQFNMPNPQVSLGQALLGVANACIDISDGLEQDLGHILYSSNVGASINLADIPLSQELSNHLEKTNDWCLPLAGGDDYQLCFSVPEARIDDLKKIEIDLGITLTKIGVITKNQNLKIVGFDNDKTCQSYQHF